MKYNILLIIIPFLFISCVHGQQIKQEGSIVIDTDLSHALFDKFSDIRSINLGEMPSGKMPGFVTKLIVHNDTLFVLDGYKSRAFFAYSSNGEPLFEYSMLGNAPNEYLFLGDMDIDKDFIYLLDNDSHKILILDKAGKYVKKQDVPARISHLKVVHNTESRRQSYYFDMYNTEKARLLRRTNKKNDTLMTTPDGMANYNYSSENAFHSNGDEIIYMPSYSSSIYKLNDTDGVQNYLNIDFKGLMPDIEVFKSLKGKRSEDKFRLMKEGYAYYYSFNANDTHILVGFVYEDKCYLLFINRLSQATNIYDLPSKFHVLTMTNNYLYLRAEDSDNLTVVNISSLNN